MMSSARPRTRNSRRRRGGRDRRCRSSRRAAAPRSPPRRSSSAGNSGCWRRCAARSVPRHSAATPRRPRPPPPCPGPAQASHRARLHRHGDGVVVADRQAELGGAEMIHRCDAPDPLERTPTTSPFNGSPQLEIARTDAPNARIASPCAIRLRSTVGVVARLLTRQRADDRGTFPAWRCPRRTAPTRPRPAPAIAAQPVAPARVAGGPEHVVGAQIEAVMHVGPHRQQDVGRDHAALRRAGGARGVDDRGRLVAAIARRLAGALSPASAPSSSRPVTTDKPSIAGTRWRVRARHAGDLGAAVPQPVGRPPRAQSR